ncbi:helix-turn-helix domain-containing protein [Paenibacillus paridis]|uniref:helix-turn-helix domain-containing protein n=1 Tax=Paenibacillus paridis TaxID=2583376 RepID=UPI001120B5C7|nr:helix-turn-helix transcriptional regulator [Paenibacillus paridis]
MLELGDRIKYLREKLNWTQPQLCERTGLTKVQLSRYETNDRKPDPDALKKLVDAVDTNADYLLGRTHDPSPNNSAVIESSYSNVGRAFLGGADKYSEEELDLARAAAKAAVEDYRKAQKKRDAKS